MGKSAKCVCRWGSRKSEGDALLETGEIIFRGDFRLVIALKEITLISAGEGELHIESSQGKVTFELGAQAEKWADKILHPPTRMDKLGVKPGARVSVIKLDDAEFLAELKSAAADVTIGGIGKQNDLIFYAAEARADLKKFASLKAAIKPAGAIWVVYPKGVKTITEAEVITGGRDAGLVDVKVARFSGRQTALKFVIPLKERSSMLVKPKPDGVSTVTPYLLTANVAKLIEFLQKVFDAEEAFRMTIPDGTIMHAQLNVAESSIMMGQAPPGHAAAKAMLYVYVADSDAVYQRAIEAGAESVHAVRDEFYGDRVGAVTDADGNQWYIATHKQDVPQEELARRAAAARPKA